MLFSGKRIMLLVAGCIFILLIYLFQQMNYFDFFVSFFSNERAFHPYTTFIFNKTFRFLINDGACFMIIAAVFVDRKYLVVSFYVFLVELFMILPFYFYVKLSLEGDIEISSPLFSFVHRLVVNPMLMLLLMIGFFYQRLKAKNLNRT